VALLNFQEAAKKGCPRCSIILNAIMKFSEQFHGVPAGEVRVGIPGEFEGGNIREIWLRWPNQAKPQAWEPKERLEKFEFQMYFPEGRVF
jgi:hypothetical protein